MATQLDVTKSQCLRIHRTVPQPKTSKKNGAARKRRTSLNQTVRGKGLEPIERFARWTLLLPCSVNCGLSGWRAAAYMMVEQLVCFMLIPILRLLKECGYSPVCDLLS